MNPSVKLVMQTTKKINKHIHETLKQPQTTISEDWVYGELKRQLYYSDTNQMILSDEEVSDRVLTIAAKRLAHNVILHERHQRDIEYIERPSLDDTYDSSSTTYGTPIERGESALRRERYDGKLPDRLSVFD